MVNTSISSPARRLAGGEQCWASDVLRSGSVKTDAVCPGTRETRRESSQEPFRLSPTGRVDVDASRITETAMSDTHPQKAAHTTLTHLWKTTN